VAGVPLDYEERVYAGVLGKIIGVYLGRPFEGWTHERIEAELGEITCYVNDRPGVTLKNRTLVVSDDDISGTFVFARALRDAGLDPSADDVAAAWLNYLVEERTVLWWGGLGNSTEHTAYLRLLAGERPPSTGSAARNGTVVSEQVGAEIFVEGLALTCPGDPELAAELAARAASVSHDGEALHGARVIAALVAGAFVETDMGRLLDTASGLIPKDSLLRRVIDDVRDWSAGTADWRDTRRRIAERYGYDRFGGNCHVIPNHALVICALAHSAGEFAPALTIINTSGWDTDSNAGNVGAITGVRGGLAGLSGTTAGVDWRGPVADRMYLPSADGGAAITDAATEALALAAHGRARHGDRPVVPKGGARFHFALPGSVQGFTADDPHVAVTNTECRLTIRSGARAVAVTTATFIPADAETAPIYGLQASPTLHSGQRVRAVVRNEDGSPALACRLIARAYGAGDELDTYGGDPVGLAPGSDTELTWTVPDTGGQPIAAVGVEIVPESGPGKLSLDRLTWDGAPDVTLVRPRPSTAPADAMANGATPSALGGAMWRRAWVDAVDRFDARWPESFRLVQNRGTGMIIHGNRGWRDYVVTADVTPHVAAAVGLAARVQGVRRYYAVELAGDGVRLVRHLGGREVLAQRRLPWTFGTTYHLALRVVGDRLEASVDDVTISCTDPAAATALDCGAIALLVTEGRTATDAVRIRPLDSTEKGTQP
jgi:ADP-ribosylglycohydrolase